MSDISDTVAAEVSRHGSSLTLMQRVSLIAAANALGLMLGGIILAAGGMVWTKAMSTDAIKDQVSNTDKALREEMITMGKMAALERAALLEEVATLKAEMGRVESLIKDEARPDPDAALFGEPALPMTPEPPAVSADAVRSAKENIQQRIDKDVYRQTERSLKN